MKKSYVLMLGLFMSLTSNVQLAEKIEISSDVVKVGSGLLANTLINNSAEYVANRTGWHRGICKIGTSVAVGFVAQLIPKDQNVKNLIYTGISWGAIIGGFQGAFESIVYMSNSNEQVRKENYSRYRNVSSSLNEDKPAIEPCLLGSLTPGAINNRSLHDLFGHENSDDTVSM